MAMELIDLSGDQSEQVFDDFSADASADYNEYAINEALNDSLNPLEVNPNEAFSETYSMSFDESPFDQAFDDAQATDLSQANDFSDGLIDTTAMPEAETIFPTVFLLPENDLDDSETAFPSFFSDAMDEEEATDDLMWQPEAIASEIGLSNPDDAILDGGFDFDISLIMADDSSNLDEFGALPSFVTPEEASVELIDEILTDPNLEISSIFDIPSDIPEFDYDQPIDNSLDDSTFTFESVIVAEDELIADELIADGELMEFNAIFDNSISMDVEDTLDTTDQEFPVFEAIASNSPPLVLPLDPLVSIDSEADESVSISRDDEFVPDFSLDFSDDWLEEITEDNENDDGFDDLADLAIGYTSAEDLSSSLLEDSNDGFDDFLDNLINESGDDFADLSSSLPDADNTIKSAIKSAIKVESVPIIPPIQNGEEDLKDLKEEDEFDFSIFESSPDSIPDSSIEAVFDIAKSEIDDFLSGNFDLDQDPSIETPKQKVVPKNPDQQTGAKPDQSISNKN
jgi:hypothetical protein